MTSMSLAASLLDLLASISRTATLRDTDGAYGQTVSRARARD